MDDRQTYQREYQRKRRAKLKENGDFDKLWAASLMQQARIKGLIKVPEHCEKCGAWSTKLDGHHADYSKPLEVVWLCRRCHKTLHCNGVTNEDVLQKLEARLQELQGGLSSITLHIKEEETEIFPALSKLSRLYNAKKDYALHIETVKDKISSIKK
jgi:hypothetical protein